MLDEMSCWYQDSAMTRMSFHCPSSSCSESPRMHLPPNWVCHNSQSFFQLHYQTANDPVWRQLSSSHSVLSCDVWSPACRLIDLSYSEIPFLCPFLLLVATSYYHKYAYLLSDSGEFGGRFREEGFVERFVVLHHLLLKKEIVGCCQVVVLVVLYGLHKTLLVETHLLLQLLHYLLINWIHSPLGIETWSFRGYLLIPGVVSDFINSEAVIRVSDKDMSEQVLGLWREELGHAVFGIQDLLI